MPFWGTYLTQQSRNERVKTTPIHAPPPPTTTNPIKESFSRPLCCIESKTLNMYNKVCFLVRGSGCGGGWEYIKAS